MIVERRNAIATALATVGELDGNVHAYKPDALAPPVGYVDTCRVVRDGATLRTLTLEAEIVIVADGSSYAARQLLDEAGGAAWKAVGRAGCVAQSMADEQLGDLPNVTYPAVRLIVTTSTEC